MQEFRSVNDVLDFAIAREEEAAQFYTDLASKMDREWMRKVFQDFAKEEQGHRAKLLGVKAGKIPLLTQAQVMDLKIGDYLVKIDADKQAADLDYQQALIVAMKKEKAAFKLYMDLANQTSEPEFVALFQSLAQEEAKHKLRFEVEYDDLFLANN
ncbi:rubrerythrin [Candidatus Vecturithrix granuli]|uniref:Rubrerythrin n=1 Tax=Vecturithrix granuli TaxID=1499967 RepID=A0A081BX91_VECG1|nr:rubrerythrin [Candidatus Vecturithrix granuli]